MCAVPPACCQCASTITWGVTAGSQSGYDFTANVPPPFDLPGPIPFFSLGSFTHRNFEVDEPWLTSVQLDVVLVISVDGVPRPPLTFTFTFNHEETPNNLNPCPYPTPPGEGCTDRVTIVASPTPTTFNVDGVDYTLSMSFLNNGSPVSEFITREGGTIMMQRSRSFIAIILVLAALRFGLRSYIGTFITAQQTAALFFVLAFGMIIRWRAWMLLEYRRLTRA